MLISIDFWNTLFDNTNGEARTEERFHALKVALEDEGQTVGDEDLRAAFRGIWTYFDHHWLQSQRTPTSLEMIREITRVAGVVLSESAQHDVADVFERGILQHSPQLLPGANAALAELATRHSLALISDTAFSPGRILRQLMERVGIAQYFTAFVFSDETGVAKPHPDAFSHAARMTGQSARDGIHIGDIERTDIVGAKGVGMRAILFRGDPTKHEQDWKFETIADAVVEHWEQVGPVAAGLLGG